MAQTTRIPSDRLEAYFDDYTKRFLRDEAPEAADVEVLSHSLGDQYVAEGDRLNGITYDPRTNALELSLGFPREELRVHRIYAPQEVWVVEEPDGFISSIEIVRADGTREVVTVKKVGLPRAG